MRDFLHRLSQGMDRPALLDRMEVDETTYDAPTLLERLGMSEQTSPLLLNRLETTNTPLFQRIEMMGTNNPIHHRMNCQEPMMGIAKSMNCQDQTKEMEIPRTNPSSIWTKLSTTSGVVRSQSSRRSPTLYRSSTSIHLGLNQPRMQPLSTM